MPNLDVLRSLAVTFVVVSHLPIANLVPSRYHVGTLGLLGVDIFFVHTCLVLMLSLHRQTLSEGSEHRAWRFLIRRFFRIYPLSCFTVLAIAATTAATFNKFDPLTVATNLALVQNLTGHASIPPALWSLPYEMQMYLLLPGLYVLVEYLGSRAGTALLALWGFSVVLVVALWRLNLNYHLVKFVPCFLSGVLAYAMGNGRKRLPPWTLFGFVLAMAALFPVVVAYGLHENVLAWPVCLILGIAISRSSQIELRPVATVAHIVAKYSFGIYLFHGPCINFAFGVLSGLPPITQYVVFALTTAASSYAGYRFIERPAIALGKSLSYDRSSSPPFLASDLPEGVSEQPRG